MHIIPGNNVAFFDVDDTLVMWDTTLINKEPERAMLFQNPDDATNFWSLIPNYKTIRALKAHKESGGVVVVWSQGGWDWCKEVVGTLELTDYVDLIISKPKVIYDDIPASSFMDNRIDLGKDFR